MSHFFSNIIISRFLSCFIEYVNRDLSHPEGGFYSAEDADSFENFSTELDDRDGGRHKREGAFYVWTWSEIHEVLPETEARVFCEYFNIDEQGNVDSNIDPHGELSNKNVPICRTGLSSFSHIVGLPQRDVQRTLDSAKQRLLRRRLETRPRPHLDNKVVTAWNGLMISGLAKAALCLDRPDCADRALRTVEFLRKYLFNEQTLLRSTYTDGHGENARIKQLSKPIGGVLDDYAFLIQGLLDLYDATMDESLLVFAKTLQEIQDTLFWDDEHGGYFFSPKETKDIIFRVKDDQDGAEPSANSVAISNLIRLGVIFCDEEYRARASQMIKLFAERLLRVPIALPEMVNSVLRHSSSPIKVILTSPTGDVSALWAVCKRVVHPFMVILQAQPESRIHLEGSYPAVNDRATAYVCRDFSCHPPTTDEAELLRYLGR